MSKGNLDKYLSIYQNKCELPGIGGEVTFSPLTTNDVKKLLVYEDSEDPIIGEEILDNIIQSAVSSDIDVDSLYLQDRYFLFFEIRKATKGTKHSYQYQCPQCNNQSLQQIDLENIKSYSLDTDYSGEVKILNGNVTLTMDHILRKEQKEGFKNLKLKGLSPTAVQVELVLNSLAQGIKQIQTPEGVEDLTFQEKVEFIEKLPSPEYDTINKWFEDNKFGLDLVNDVTCPHCGHERKSEVSLQNFFS